MKEQGKRMHFFEWTSQLRGHYRALLLLGEERALHFGHLRQARQAGHLQIPQQASGARLHLRVQGPSGGSALERMEAVGFGGNPAHHAPHHEALVQQCATSLLRPELKEFAAEFAVLCITTEALCPPLTSSSLIS